MSSFCYHLYSLTTHVCKVLYLILINLINFFKKILII
jgi:hypothetical protein